MSNWKSDPTRLGQFLRRWDEEPVQIKFLSEMTPRELVQLSRRLGEKRLKRLQERRERERKAGPQGPRPRNPGGDCS